ncbi:MAG: hypothetical protein M1815_000961 [Lichina confinis]|nr:MAG: hypothetical protein M1815_000961 [Lichina confinis]
MSIKADATSPARAAAPDGSRRSRQRPLGKSSHSLASLTLKDVANSNSTMHAFMGGRQKAWMTAGSGPVTPASRSSGGGVGGDRFTARSVGGGATPVTATTATTAYAGTPLPESTPTTSTARESAAPAPSAALNADSDQPAAEAAPPEQSLLPSPAPSVDVPVREAAELSKHRDVRMVDVSEVVPTGTESISGQEAGSCSIETDDLAVLFPFVGVQSEPEDERRSSRVTPAPASAAPGATTSPASTWNLDDALVSATAATATTTPTVAGSADGADAGADVGADVGIDAGADAGVTAAATTADEEDADIEVIWSRPRPGATSSNNVDADSLFIPPTAQQDVVHPRRPVQQAVPPCHPPRRVSLGPGICLPTPPTTATTITTTPQSAHPLGGVPNEASRPTPNANPPRAYGAAIDRYVVGCGGEHMLEQQIVLPRVELLRRACTLDDSFYLALHQIYCLNTMEPGKLMSVPGFGLAHITALGILALLIHPNERLPKHHLAWFSSYPAPWGILVRDSPVYLQAVRQVRDFLPSLLSEWQRYSDMCCRRDMPPLVPELTSIFNLKSVTFQYVIFTAIHRRMVGDLPPALFKAYAEVFMRDQTEFYDALSRMHTTGQVDTNRAEQVREGCVLAYRRLRQRHPPSVSDIRSSAQSPTDCLSRSNPHLASIDWSNGRPQVARPLPPPPTPPINGGSAAASTQSSAGVANRRALRPLTVTVPSSGFAMAPGATPPASNVQVPHGAYQVYPQYNQLAQPTPQISPRQPRLASRPQSASYDDDVAAMGAPPGLRSAASTPLSSSAVVHQFPQVNSVSSSPASGFRNLASTGSQAYHRVEPSQSRHVRPQSANQAARTTQQQLQLLQQQQQQLQRHHQHQQQLQQHQQQQMQQQQHQQQHRQQHQRQQQSGGPTGVRPLVPLEHASAEPPSITNSTVTALHLTYLRSPRLRTRERLPPEGSASRLYRHVTGFRRTPLVLPTEPTIVTFEFHVDREAMQLLPQRDLTTSTPRSDPVWFVGDKSVMYRLRCCALGPGSNNSCAEHEWAVKDTLWPDHVFIEVNGAAMDVRRKFHHGKDVAMDITPAIVEGRNVVRISTLRTERETQRQALYAVAVEDVGFITRQGIFQMCFLAPRFEARGTLKQIVATLASDPGDDELSVVDSQVTVSVTDPFMARMFDNPVRSIHCLHRDCFDFHTFLATRKRSSSSSSQRAPGGVGNDQDPTAPCSVDDWKCPLCGTDARPAKLRVDQFLQNVRAKLAEACLNNVKAIVVRRDGTWAPKMDSTTMMMTTTTTKTSSPSKRQETQGNVGERISSTGSPGTGSPSVNDADETNSSSRLQPTADAGKPLHLVEANAGPMVIDLD